MDVQLALSAILVGALFQLAAGVISEDRPSRLILYAPFVLLMSFLSIAVAGNMASSVTTQDLVLKFATAMRVTGWMSILTYMIRMVLRLYDIYRHVLLQIKIVEELSESGGSNKDEVEQAKTALKTVLNEIILTGAVTAVVLGVFFAIMDW